MKERINYPTTEELADIGIGAGLVMLGPGMAKYAFEQGQLEFGGDIDYFPDNETLQEALELGIDVAGDVAGIAAIALIMWAGLKKMFRAASFNKAK